MKTIRIAVIGGGFWGRNQLRILSEIPEAILVGLCDKDRKIEKFAENYEIPFYLDLQGLLSQEEVDAVTICTPTTTHYQMASQALDHGIHVLIEKPMTSTLQEARRLLRKGERQGSFISVGFIERFNPAVHYVKDYIEKGGVGRAILVLARRVTRWPSRVGDVGVTKDSAIHDVDIMRYLLGREVISVYSKTGSLKHRFEDYSEIMLEFEEGIVGFIDSNWLTPRKIRNLVVTGSEATVHIDYISQMVTVDDSEKSVRPKIEWREPLKVEMENFIGSLLENKQPQPCGLDGLRALEVCEAVLESSRKARIIRLSASP